MPKTRRGPNDRSNSEERLKKTIRHMEAAEITMEYASEKDVAAIKKKNEQRAESVEDLEKEIKAAEKSGLKGYL
ncbi:small, acid-soluble spore protein tlp [Psychrobacillus psychrodurans]|uniref:Small, acid-soluble spore protein tlp n=1 Tax=Psychrobacillus psychrodurans TaxID=126157 RepID=A0A9X3L9Y5_9BACI|nr:small, acid-soluble spore protein tlp [Psychrobacillus psychrodurans]MCZ8533862.1 small, acid-soluble spore protein tlp [Psychrobacillus psychrodurans]